MKKAVTKNEVKSMVKKAEKKDVMQDKKMMGNKVMKKSKDCEY